MTLDGIKILNGFSCCVPDLCDLKQLEGITCTQRQCSFSLITDASLSWKELFNYYQNHNSQIYANTWPGLKNLAMKSMSASTGDYAAIL